jgi:UDP-N-acetylglucosamine transferase subunit ALG13
MILVTVGTEKFPFDRLMHWIEELMEADLLGEEVVVQYGTCTVLPAGSKVYRLMRETEFRALIQQARVVVAHCGEGTVLLLDAMETPFILVPRSQRYREHVDYLADTRTNLAHFGLAEPELIRAFSTDTAARGRVARGSWDAIYIDGNHDYEVARADWDLCATHVAPGGIIVLDDSAMDTAYRAPAFATAGHPGPSQVASEINRNEFREILCVGHNRVFQRTV